jgi:non-homologous end joining protein Ku
MSIKRILVPIPGSVDHAGEIDMCVVRGQTRAVVLRPIDLSLSWWGNLLWIEDVRSSHALFETFLGRSR